MDGEEVKLIGRKAYIVILSLLFISSCGGSGSSSDSRENIPEAFSIDTYSAFKINTPQQTLEGKWLILTRRVEVITRSDDPSAKLTNISYKREVNEARQALRYGALLEFATLDCELDEVVYLDNGGTLELVDNYGGFQSSLKVISNSEIKGQLIAENEISFGNDIEYENIIINVHMIKISEDKAKKIGVIDHYHADGVVDISEQSSILCLDHLQRTRVSVSGGAIVWEDETERLQVYTDNGFWLSLTERYYKGQNLTTYGHEMDYNWNGETWLYFDDASETGRETVVDANVNYFTYDAPGLFINGSGMLSLD